MSNLDKLAQMLRPKENEVGIVTGKVIGIDPLRVSVGQNIILEVSGEDRTTKLVVSRSAQSLEVDDRVIVIPDNKLKKWYVIDRVVSG